jgi:hypothetical protein
MKRVYIAGPMRGIAEFNFPMFDAARNRGNGLGLYCVSPADLDRAAGFDGIGMKGEDCEYLAKIDIAATLKRDLDALLTCQAIALLPGWEKSRGANAELAWARLLGMEILDAETFRPFDPDSKPLPVTGKDGTKFDEGKPRYDLLAPDALDGLVAVLTFGAKKYSDRNWEAGISYGRVFGAAMRHLWAWWRGEENDNETGLSHLDHAACCIHFLSAYVKRGKKWRDDRRGK